MMVSFDLPTKEKRQQSAYRKFMKYLKTNGYVMLQESIYLKLLHNSANTALELRDIEINSPQQGEVLVIPLSLAQFRKIRFIRGEPFDISLFSDEVLVI